MQRSSGYAIADGTMKTGCGLATPSKKTPPYVIFDIYNENKNIGVMQQNQSLDAVPLKVKRSYRFHPFYKSWKQSMPLDAKNARVNMRMLKWNSYLAFQAQRHANRCTFQHSKDRTHTGENIWAAPFSDISDSVKLWFSEIFNRRCGCTNYFKACCGHYTQVVWAESELLGCGLSYCNRIHNAPGHKFILVCHYWPSGNWVHFVNGSLVGYPAFRRSKNGPCSECPKEYDCLAGLCHRQNDTKQLRQYADNLQFVAN
ncbi:Protein lon-1 [Trichinella spiralis]|uniref:Protein lon-1 n=1 Tax=Trichinella spiralis TaxID=6334 RepID=A0A0V1BN33_TRISP|nr:Protein lon-1 [Trichinella spiralis]